MHSHEINKFEHQLSHVKSSPLWIFDPRYGSVVAEVLQDDDFLGELERLTSSFGIGIISLDLSNINSSAVLYPARGKDFLDWETINKLCEQNGNFAKFVEDVKIDFESKRIHSAEYDEIPKDQEKYIAEKLGIEQSD